MPRAGNVRRCSAPRWTPASATSPPSSSWSGRASRRARRSTPPCSRRKARRSARKPLPAICHSPVPRLLDHPLADDDRENVAMATSASTTPSAQALANLTGTILLVGAGKMGGAMLEGWLALGVEPRRVAVLEPQPTPEIAVLAGRGVTLNPAPAAVA